MNDIRIKKNSKKDDYKIYTEPAYSKDKECEIKYKVIDGKIYVKDFKIKIKNCKNVTTIIYSLTNNENSKINKLATVIERISKALEVYFDDDNRATREIERIINEVITK